MGGDVFIMRHISDGLSKCSIVIHAESGSTVAAYSNSAATTKVKDAKEIGTSGSYVITGLNTGTYYVKAEKGTKSKTSSEITFSAYAVKDVVLTYNLDLIIDGRTQRTFTSKNATVRVVTDQNFVGIKGNTSDQYVAYYYVAVDVTNYSTLHIRGFNSGDTQNNVHAGINVGSSYTSTAKEITFTTTRRNYTIDVSGLSGTMYIALNATSFQWNPDTGEMHRAEAAVEDMWLE